MQLEGISIAIYRKMSVNPLKRNKNGRLNPLGQLLFPSYVQCLATRELIHRMHILAHVLLAIGYSGIRSRSHCAYVRVAIPPQQLTAIIHRRTIIVVFLIGVFTCHRIFIVGFLRVGNVYGC